MQKRQHPESRGADVAPTVRPQRWPRQGVTEEASDKGERALHSKHRALAMTHKCPQLEPGPVVPARCAAQSISSHTAFQAKEEGETKMWPSQQQPRAQTEPSSPKSSQLTPATGGLVSPGRDRNTSAPRQSCSMASDKPTKGGPQCGMH